KARFLGIPSDHQRCGDWVWRFPERSDFISDGCNGSLSFHGGSHERVEVACCPQCCAGGSDQQELPGMSELDSDRRPTLRLLHLGTGCSDQGISERYGPEESAMSN